MAAAVKRLKNKPRLAKPARDTRTDLLSYARPSEINWHYVAPMLQGQQAGDTPFVYFIGEEDEGPVKIGYAMDPVQRLRELQTGNPRRLRIEVVIYGDRRSEQTLHDYWRVFARGGKTHRNKIDGEYERETEWFAPEARERILDTAIFISNMQKTAVKGGADWNEMYGMIGHVMTDFGYELERGDKLRYLARGPGYVTKKLRPGS